MALGVILKRLFVAAAAVTGGSAGYAYLKDDENRQEAADAVGKVATDVAENPGDTFNAFADGSLNFLQNIDQHATDYGNAVLGAGEKTVNFVSDPSKAIEDAATRKLNETFGIEADGEGNEGGGLMKWLLGGGAALAVGGLLSKFFGKKDSDHDSGGGLGIGGTLVIASAVFAAITDAFGIRTKITNMFNELTGSDERTMDMTQDTSAEQNVRVGQSFFEEVPEGPGL